MPRSVNTPQEQILHRKGTLFNFTHTLYQTRYDYFRCHTEIDTMQRCTGYSINDEHATLLTIVNRCKGVVSENRLCKQFFQFAGLQTCCKFLATSL